ncbi:Spartin [Triplophysa tibetana]|uniref:Spartin n=1 Tax=Triplophysa tibetana TaxID=1572043 RepID=A0A5A9N6D0_9TELE|nr:Spartin [Triplophysa tibetana]
MESAEPAEVQKIRECYDKALQCVKTGLQYDEMGNKAQALIMYRRGRQHLASGLEVNTQGNGCVGPSWDFARQTQLKMYKTLSTIKTRLTSLESTPTQGQRLYPALPVLQHPQPLPNRSHLPGDQISSSGGVPALPASPVAGLAVPSELPPPPVYTQQPTEGHLSISHGGSYQSVPNQIPQRQAVAPVNLREAGMEILLVPSGVQMFFVSAEGHVSAPSYPGYLRLLLYRNQNAQGGASYAPAYLQVCDWIYPLYPDSPVFLSNKGVFTFPDITAAVPGSYVGVVLSSELPAADSALFQEQLSLLAQLRVQVDDGPVGATGTDKKVPIVAPSEASVAPEGDDKTIPGWSELISQSILTGTSWLSQGLVRGAEATSKAINKGGTWVRENTTPEETPAEVSPAVTKSLYAARQATIGAVKVSQYLVDGVATVASKVGKELAPHIKKQGDKLIPETFKTNKDGTSTVDGAKLVAGTSIQGLSTVWSSLETAGKTIGKSLTSETVSTVRHKYGDEAGHATDTAVQSAVNIGVTAFNVDNLGIKGLMKSTGKQTAKALVSPKSEAEKSEMADKSVKKEQYEKK